jgi:hypothetical protein
MSYGIAYPGKHSSFKLEKPGLRKSNILILARLFSEITFVLGLLIMKLCIFLSIVGLVTATPRGAGYSANGARRTSIGTTSRMAAHPFKAGKPKVAKGARTHQTSEHI